jgi:cobalt-zinc-cadmium efflux system membrane fusion protein
MTKSLRWLAVALALAGLPPESGRAAGDTFSVSDQQLARLGVTLRPAEVAELVEYAAAPAEVVVPPARQAVVNASHGGVVVRVLVAEGDLVAARQAVAEIDSLNYVEHQRDYVEAAAAAELAAAQEARDRSLYEEGIIAERRVAESAAAARAARARVDHLRAELELAGITPADLARVAQQRELSQRIVLRSPFAGVVAAVHAAVGARVDALDPVVALADLSELWLELRVPQESAAHIVAGMLVAAESAGRTVNGTITTVGGVVDAATQTVLVRAVVDNARGTLRAGQFLNTHVLARPEGIVYAVPGAAVTRHEGESFVFVRRGSELVAQRVGLVADDGERSYIASGLGPSSLVAVDGVSALKSLWLSSAEDVEDGSP